MDGTAVFFALSDLARSTELQFFMRAYDYLYAAHLTWSNKPVRNSLLSPTLFLVSHAIELTLKANLLLCGQTEAKILKYGHRIIDLWESPLNSELRSAASEIECRISDSTGGIVDRTVRKLAPLHWSPGGKIELRYEAEPESFGPVPNIAVPVFVILSRIGMRQAIENLKVAEPKSTTLDDFETEFELSYFAKWDPLV